MRDSPAFHELHGIQWRGFGEVDYKVLNQKIPELGTFGFVPGSAGSFYIGDFDLLLTSRLNDKASVLAEVVFGEEDAQTFNVDLERALFKRRITIICECHSGATIPALATTTRLSTAAVGSKRPQIGPW